MSEGELQAAGVGLCVAELPPEWQPAAKAVGPALKEVLSGLDPLSAYKIVSAAMQDQLARSRRPHSELAVALTRGDVVREEMKAAEGGSISAEEASALLGMSKEAVLKRFRKGQMLGWREVKQNAVRFPVWQFKDKRVLPGVPEVLAVLNSSAVLDDWSKILFFLSPRSSLSRKHPLDLLREGDGNLPAVIRAAKGYTAE